MGCQDGRDARHSDVEKPAQDGGQGHGVKKASGLLTHNQHRSLHDGQRLTRGMLLDKDDTKGAKERMKKSCTRTEQLKKGT